NPLRTFRTSTAGMGGRSMRACLKARASVHSSNRIEAAAAGKVLADARHRPGRLALGFVVGEEPRCERLKSGAAGVRLRAAMPALLAGTVERVPCLFLGCRVRDWAPDALPLEREVHPPHRRLEAAIHGLP